ncbi:hypothetical protein JCM8208_006259 [Rhodotorula glutinis]
MSTNTANTSNGTDPAVPHVEPSSTYNEDVVELHHPDGRTSQAVVTRCWADEQAPEPVSEAARLGISFTPLAPGRLEVLHPDGTKSEVDEKDVAVVDKGFLRGDIIRKRTTASTAHKKHQAGQIVDLKTEVQLQRVLDGEVLPGWHDTSLLCAANRIARSDHVVEPSSGWIGVVEDVFEMAMIEAGNGVVRRVCDGGATLSVGNGTDVIKAMLEERGEGVLAHFLAAADLKQIIDVKQCMIAVNWLCRSQQASSDSWDRPKRYWVDLDRLVLVRSTVDHLHTVYDKVVFRDPALFPAQPSRWRDSYPDGHRVLAITATRTEATVLWQDGTTTTGPTPSFEQFPGVDEDMDVFPGDVGLFSGVSPPRIGVVQSHDSRRRTIKLRYLSARAEPLSSSGEAVQEDEEETVSGLEFDPHGPPPDAYGVRRGDLVLITREGQNNGATVPTVPKLGESEVAAGLMPSGDELRIELSTLGLAYCQTLPDTFIPPKAQESPAAFAPITWYGEVWDLLLDGRALVRFPNGDKQAFPIHRLVLLDDGIDPEGELNAALDGEDDAMSTDEGESGSESDGSWMTEDDGDAVMSAAGGDDLEGVVDAVMEDDSQDEDYKTEEEGAQVDAPRRSGRRKGRAGDEDAKGWADEDDDLLEADAAPAPVGVDGSAAPSAAAAPEPSSAAAAAAAVASSSSSSAATATSPASTAPAPAPAATSVSMPGEVEEDFADWSRFEVLEEAPLDHHYIGEPVQVPGKAFMSRMRKEHKVLASSLPPNILVRAYENRLDLLRCLIIGPLDTPFQNAPFLFDVFLPPSKFPQDPPQVFFHSWASGNRVSPNLYVEGKVCLSLLGTWSGDKDENWSAAKSSILQIFISIQGLIMVENPYFTEPGFEKQMGTPEATAASELYNERTLVLTRAFVKRACEYPPSSFAREIAAYFFTGLPGQQGGALAAIIEQSKRLLDESERWHAREGADGEGDGDEAKPPQSAVVPSQRVLTEGAGLSLRRTVKALEELVKRGPKVDEAGAA